MRNARTIRRYVKLMPMYAISTKAEATTMEPKAFQTLIHMNNFVMLMQMLLHWEEVVVRRTKTNQSKVETKMTLMRKRKKRKVVKTRRRKEKTAKRKSQNGESIIWLETRPS